MKFNEVAINQNFKTLKEITDLYDNPKDLVELRENYFEFQNQKRNLAFHTFL